MDEQMAKAWAEWRALYLDAISKGSSEPVITRIAAAEKADEFYKPVFEAGFIRGWEAR